MLEIVDIDFSLPFHEFSTIIEEVIGNESSNKGISFDWEWKEASLSKSNSNVYKITLNNLDSNNKIEMVANKLATNEIAFKPIQLRNFNNTFFKWDYMDDDLLDLMMILLKTLAIKSKGSFGCILNDKKFLINGGRDISNHITGIGLIDDKGHVHHLKHGQTVDEEDDDYSSDNGYVPKYLINEWLDENIQFQAKLKDIPKKEQFELMAQYAVYQKKKNMITADQFRDILIQVGSFSELIGGFNDETIKNIYQLFI